MSTSITSTSARPVVRQDPVEHKKNEAVKATSGVERTETNSRDARTDVAKSNPGARAFAMRELQPHGVASAGCAIGGKASAPNASAPNASAPNASASNASATPAIVQQLAPAQRATLESTFAGANGASVRDSVSSLVSSQGFQRLDAESQRRTLNTVADPQRAYGAAGGTLGGTLGGTFGGASGGAQPPRPLSGVELQERTDDARRLVDSRAMGDASPPQRSAMVTTFAQADNNGRTAMLALANPVNGSASPLLAPDHTGAPMIDSLHALATQPLAQALEPQRTALLSSTIEEAQDPARTINQDNRGTCAATTVQYQLARTNPAEYARLVAGIASPAGSVQLANGETMTRVADAVAPDDSTRSPSERLLQSSFMDFANGTLTYRNDANNGATGPANETENGRDASFDEDGNRGAGLMLGETRRLLSAVTGQEHQSDTVWAEDRLERDASTVRRVATELYDLVPNLSTMPNLRDPWTSLALRQAQDPSAQTSVALSWGSSGHEVTVERIDDGRVYFRNPWGAQPEIAAGTNLNDPPRRMEDPTRGIASMSIDDFRARLRGAVVPS